MEHVASINLAGAAYLGAHMFQKRRAEKASTPPSLPNVLDTAAKGKLGDRILSVHVDSATLDKQFKGKQYKMRVKYGEQRKSVACDTKCAQARLDHSAMSQFVAQVDSTLKLQAKASFNTTCLFSAVPREVNLRNRFIEPGFVDRPVARAEIKLPRLSYPRVNRRPSGNPERLLGSRRLATLLYVSGF